MQRADTQEAAMFVVSLVVKGTTKVATQTISSKCLININKRQPVNTKLIVELKSMPGETHPETATVRVHSLTTSEETEEWRNFGFVYPKLAEWKSFSAANSDPDLMKVTWGV